MAENNVPRAAYLNYVKHATWGRIGENLGEKGETDTAKPVKTGKKPGSNGRKPGEKPGNEKGDKLLQFISLFIVHFILQDREIGHFL